MYQQESYVQTAADLEFEFPALAPVHLGPVLEKKTWQIETPHLRLGTRLWKGAVFVHCEIEHWSPTVMRDCKKQWPMFLKHLVSLGYKKIYSAVPADDKLINKWQRLWGMKLVKINKDYALYTKELDHGHS